MADADAGPVRLAGEAAETLKRTSEAHFINLIELQKTRDEDIDTAFLARRVFRWELKPEEAQWALCKQVELVRDGTAGFVVWDTNQDLAPAFCSKQVKNLTGYYKDIVDLGAKLIVITPKPLETTRRVAQFFEVEFDFWLDDAFASGGSQGYDHKKMGITARGAWESVKRCFRELGVDTQTTAFTAVGIGDMSGDVFGNGMLLSRHIRLLAAFNHMHIFIDPEPEAASSFFSLPSIWRTARGR